jgi:Family of unknown function (DUF6687)
VAARGIVAPAANPGSVTARASLAKEDGGMKFVPYQLLDGRPSVIMDGSPAPGTVLTVTHWPGYPPPAGIEDDLSAQMAFRLLKRPDLVPDEAEAVSNNHFDQDGLVSLYAMVTPDDAVHRRTFLEDVAFAGDLAVCRDRDAARVSMLLAALSTADDLPADYTERTGVLYEDVLGRLPQLCDHLDRYRDAWSDEDATLDASDAAFEDGRAVIEERPDLDLALVTIAEDTPDAGGHRFGGDWVSGLHPMAVNTRTERVTLARIRGRRYDVELRYEGWIQFQSRPVRPRRDLVPLAARLQDEEAGGAVWSATPVGGLLPSLSLADGQESSITLDRFVELLTDHLRTAPPAWNPFEPRR